MVIHHGTFWVFLVFHCSMQVDTSRIWEKLFFVKAFSYTQWWPNFVAMATSMHWCFFDHEVRSLDDSLLMSHQPDRIPTWDRYVQSDNIWIVNWIVVSERKDKFAWFSIASSRRRQTVTADPDRSHERHPSIRASKYEPFKKRSDRRCCPFWLLLPSYVNKTDWCVFAPKLHCRYTSSEWYTPNSAANCWCGRWFMRLPYSSCGCNTLFYATIRSCSMPRVCMYLIEK